MRPKAIKSFLNKDFIETNFSFQLPPILLIEKPGADKDFCVSVLMGFA